MTEDEMENEFEDVPPPDNSDSMEEVNYLDLMEYELPLSEEFPPDELQARLEAPTMQIILPDATVARLDPIVEAGVERVWSETDEMVNNTEDSSFAIVDLTGGQLDVESAASDTEGQG